MMMIKRKRRFIEFPFSGCYGEASCLRGDGREMKDLPGMCGFVYFSVYVKDSESGRE